MCLENVIYITKQEKVSIYYLGPFLGEFVRAKRKPNFGNVIAWSAKKLDQFLLFYLSLRANRFAQWKTSFRLVIILLPVKYLLKLSGSRNFYRLRMTSLTSTNVFTISCLSIEPNPPPPPRAQPPPRFGKFISTARCKVSIALFVDYSSTIRRLFADYSYYSSTIRRLFVDYSYYSLTIRGLFALFVDYSRTIRTIRRLFALFALFASLF